MMLLQLQQLYGVGCEYMTYVTSLLWATVWGERESECCAHTYVSACSLVVMENRTVNYRLLVVKTYFETKSIMKMQACFRPEFDDPRHDRIRTRNVVIQISAWTSAILRFLAVLLSPSKQISEWYLH
jgi:hypothetical protein